MMDGASVTKLRLPPEPTAEEATFCFLAMFATGL